MILRMSKMYAPTLKEDPSDAELASHRLLLRAGMMRKNAAGLYTFLPFGMRVLKKVEAIVNEEMDGIGAQQILMPFVQPAVTDEIGELSELQEKTGIETSKLCQVLMQMCISGYAEETVRVSVV